MISEETLRRIKTLIGVGEGFSVDAPILRGKSVRQVAEEIAQLLKNEFYVGVDAAKQPDSTVGMTIEFKEAKPRRKRRQK